ncbi:MAG: hypothetical protein OXC44_04215 [Proteobacteria bacterium]|nr:hypothetical protein [Pseudomonadota bacterium]
MMDAAHDGKIDVFLNSIAVSASVTNSQLYIYHSGSFSGSVS